MLPPPLPPPTLLLLLLLLPPAAVPAVPLMAESREEERLFRPNPTAALPFTALSSERSRQKSSILRTEERMDL
jgi:hypothetical protein